MRADAGLLIASSPLPECLLPSCRICDGLGAFDAVLAAAALDGGAKALVSGDRAFSDVPGLDHRFPDHEGLEGILPSPEAPHA